MEIFKMLNLLIRFLLELCMLVAVGYWGFTTHLGWMMKILFGIGLPVLIAVLWGMFIAPKAVYPLHGPLFLAVELVLFGLGALALFASGQSTLGWTYMIILFLNKLMLASWKAERTIK